MKNLAFLVILIISSQTILAQNFAWVQSWGGPLWDNSRAVAIDGDGNVFLTGYFNSTMDADSGPAKVNLISLGGRDIFVNKFNASGKLIWAKQMSGINNEQAVAIASDVAGNIYITGTFEGTVDFDPSSGIFNLTAEQIDTYICKLDNDGNFIFVKQFYGGASAAYDIAIDANQNIYTAGRFNAVTDFDPSAGQFNLDAQNYTDAFICKLDATGTLIWAKQLAENEDTTSIKAESIAIDINGNVYTTGIFKGVVDFDPGSGVFNISSTTAGLDNDVFVCKLNAGGDFIWASTLSGTSIKEPSGIAVDENENVYMTGYFSNTADFDPGAGVFELTSLGIGADSYVWKLDINGNLVWAKSFGGSPVLAQDIKLVNDNIYLAGYFSGTTDFDPGTSSNLVTSTGGFDVFASKLDLDGNFLWVQKTGGLASESAYAFAVDSTSGSVFITGIYTDSTDFDPSSEIWKIVSKGEEDNFLVKLTECTVQNGVTQSATACNQYVWPENGGIYNESGLYWNILTSVAGCDSTIKLDLNLSNYETETTFSGGLLSVTSSAFVDEFQWINCETFEVVSTIGSFHPTVSGFYAVITKSGICIDTSNCISITAGTAGLSDLKSFGFSLYPNPVTDYLVLQSEDINQPFSIEISSINGQLIYSGKHSNGDILNMQNWKTGFYIVKITDGDLWFVTKIMKN